MPVAVLDARRGVLDRVGGGGVYTTTSAGNVGGSTLVCTTAWDNASFPADHLDYAWVHVPSTTAPKQRMVTAGGLASASGTFTVDGSFGAQIGSGVEFELSTKIPLIGSGARDVGLSINEALVRASRLLLVEQTISRSVFDGDTDIDLSDLFWLDSPARVTAVRHLDPLGVRYVETWRPYEVRRTGGVWKLHFDAPWRLRRGSELLEIGVRRPASTWVYTAAAAAFDDSVTGPLSDTDQVDVRPDDLETVAYAIVLRALRDASVAPDWDRYDGLYREQLAEARSLTNYDREHDPDRTVPSPSGGA